MPPSKNRINMHDIIAQPLGAVVDAVNSVLRRPEKLDVGEVQSLFRETSFLLLRVEEALSIRNEEAGAALILLLLEGLTHSEESLQLGLTTFSVERGLLTFFNSVFKLVFRDGALPLQSPGAADVAQIICTLSECEVLKDPCGELFFDELVEILSRLYQNPDAANTHVQTQRSVAASLINLVKGSPKNKQRRSDWRFLLFCLTATVDVFFQLQCIELLYRLSRKNRAVLYNLFDQQHQQTSTLSSSKMKEILLSLDHLPNDQSLLSQMIEMIQKINAGRKNVVSFSVVEVTAGETVLAKPTLSFFTPHFFVVLLTSSSADNISIPYTCIRSVTISKEGRVFFRLESFPMSVEPFLHHSAPGMDSIGLLMSPSTLGELKSSPVRSWIIQLLQEKCSHSSTSLGLSTSKKDELLAVTPASFVNNQKLSECEKGKWEADKNKIDTDHALDKREHGASRKRSMEKCVGDLPDRLDCVERKETGEGEVQLEVRREKESTSLFSAPASPLTLKDNQGESAELLGCPGRKRFKQENAEEPSSSFSLNIGVAHPLVAEQLTSLDKEEEKMAAKCAYGSEIASRDAALSSLLSRLIRRMPQKEQHSFLLQLENLMLAKRERKEEDNAARLRNGVATLQKRVDEAREKCQGRRDQWFSELSTGMNQVDTEIKMVEETSSAAVDKLNEGLRQIKASNQAVGERLSCMRLRLQQILESSRGVEDDGSTAILAHCDEELDRQDCLFVQRHQEKMEFLATAVLDI